LKDNICVICAGEKIFMGHPCSFCNGTGEWNEASESYYNNHVCQCFVWGREFCPICKKKCHHESTASPKQKIVPGYGGMSNHLIASTSGSNTTINVSNTAEMEEMILA